MTNVRVCLHCKNVWEIEEAPYCEQCGYGESVFAQAGNRAPSSAAVGESKHNEEDILQLRGARDIIVRLLANLDPLVQSADPLQRGPDLDQTIQEAFILIGRLDKSLTPKSVRVPEQQYF
jgi:hypothetical protein